MTRHIATLAILALLGAGCATKTPETPPEPVWKPSAVRADGALRSLYVICVEGKLTLDVRFERPSSTMIQFPVGTQEECADFFAKREMREWFDDTYKAE